MENLLILYGPDSATNKAIVDEVKNAFAAADFSSKVKAASESSIVDIASADVILFGSEKTGGLVVPKDYAALARMCRGANLAGKCAGFFALGTDKPSSELRAALEKSDISILNGEAAFSERENDRKSKISEWVREISRSCREIRNARG
jgi:flavodoxin